MGLDMYLTAERFIWFDEDQLKEAVAKVIPRAPGEARSISFDVGYWRKANAIHKWFVDNVQNGEDNCQRYYVSKEQLRELYDTVAIVLAGNGKPEEDLPTQEGFFFGSPAYDEWYMDDLRYTQDILGKILQFLDSKEGKHWDIYYQSSW